MYSRDEIRALTDKVLSMAKADAGDVSFDGGERSAPGWASSSITVNGKKARTRTGRRGRASRRSQSVRRTQ